MILWLLFALSLPFRLYTSWLAFGAMLCGVIKRFGYPKFNKEYLQMIAYDDNFQMITYLGTLTMNS